MKFSIIIPVYNVEKYISKCLESVLSQSYENYEVILVNDGSTDGSYEIIEQYEKRDDRISCHSKENGGLSDARNYGLQFVTGDYILFLDSDDYWESGLLEQINTSLEDGQADMLRFSFQKVDESGNVLQKIVSQDFCCLSSSKAIPEILKEECVETAWSYAYKTDFFIGNHFCYPVGYYHEDYGLTPYILLKAKTISALPYIGLNYVQRSGSIMNAGSYNKEIKKANDTLDLFLQLQRKIAKLTVDEPSRELIMNFLTTVLLEKLKVLKSPEKENYVHNLRQLKLSQYFNQKGLKGMVKKIWARIGWNSYCKFFY